MGDKMQADGGGSGKAAADGVGETDTHGKTGGGESSGGGYDDGHPEGREPKGGFLGTGGQTEQEYHGGADGVAREED